MLHPKKPSCRGYFAINQGGPAEMGSRSEVCLICQQIYKSRVKKTRRHNP